MHKWREEQRADVDGELGVEPCVGLDLFGQVSEAHARFARGADEGVRPYTIVRDDPRIALAANEASVETTGHGRVCCAFDDGAAVGK